MNKKKGITTNWFTKMGVYKTRLIALRFILPVLLLISTVELNYAQDLQLNNLDSFNNPPDSWQIKGDVKVNPVLDGSFQSQEGTGILVGTSSQSEGPAKIQTNATHGDFVLELDVLLSHGTSATLWLQGLYGLRLSDSWKSKELNHTDNGAIIPSNLKSSSVMGFLPSLNASRAPGTWQHVKIIFNSPRFNSDGDKVRRARVISVEQNGSVIQENQYLSGPSTGAIFAKEEAKGPLIFQVDNGHIAFKNIKWEMFSEEQIQLKELSYKLYVDQYLDDEFIYWGGGEDDDVHLPQVEEREPDQSGSIKQLHTRMVRDKGNNFAIVFEGELHIPKSGRYNFEVVPNGVGSLTLDYTELTRWNALHNKGSTNTSVDLEEGTHSYHQLYINYGQPRAGLFISGPGIKYQPLHEDGAIPSGNNTEPIILSPNDKPQIQRSFLHLGDRKLLTIMNVGSADGVHYSFNMETGGLAQAWRGPFGDATPMWHGRGVDQVLEPLGSVLSFDADQQVLLTIEPISEGKYAREGYALNSRNEPVFEYTVGDVRVKDHVRPERNRPVLRRSLKFVSTTEDSQRLWYRLASGSTIEKVTERLYAVDNKRYYIQVYAESIPEIHHDQDQQILVVPIEVGAQTQRLSYSIIW